MMNKPEKENYTHKQIPSNYYSANVCSHANHSSLFVVVFNTADAIMPSCHKSVSRHFQTGISPSHTNLDQGTITKRLLPT